MKCIRVTERGALGLGVRLAQRLCRTLLVYIAGHEAIGRLQHFSQRQFIRALEAFDRLDRFFVWTGIFSCFVSAAQLCTGSLGDPVVNITFGTGGNSGSGFIAPGYNYTSSSCPNDGFYTITSSTSGCFGNSWHTVNADHTGNGAFMLVNASVQPGDFYVGTVTGLCPNTTYEFSAWIMNVLLSASGIKPDITFSIETPSGTILNQYNTGGINVTAQPLWEQYGFFFTTTAGNPDVVLRMTNNAPGGGGNDPALDDITFRPWTWHRSA